MREVAVIGVGSTVFGKLPDRLVKDIGADAVWAAIDDAGISPKDIQVAYDHSFEWRDYDALTPIRNQGSSVISALT